tara:strand:+ start:122 stop:343 length:222 start_codon:yes stop_codon:yes gene_type:complete
MAKITVGTPEGTITRDYTEAEEAQLVIDIAAGQAHKEAVATAATQKATNKANGNQKLLDLGLTQAEVDAVTGQ